MAVIVIYDGSTDTTASKLSELNYPWLQVMTLEKNGGKAGALNQGLAKVRSALTVTIDGDSYLYHNALNNLVRRYMSDPPNTRAVAGAVLVRNSRKNGVTAVQEWDYFQGIAAIKRLQSLYQGTLVAQGAFSVYSTALLREMGGWPRTVGEAIVLTWDIWGSPCAWPSRRTWCSTPVWTRVSSGLTATRKPLGAPWSASRPGAGAKLSGRLGSRRAIQHLSCRRNPPRIATPALWRSSRFLGKSLQTVFSAQKTLIELLTEFWRVGALGECLYCLRR